MRKPRTHVPIDLRAEKAMSMDRPLCGRGCRSGFAIAAIVASLGTLEAAQAATLTDDSYISSGQPASEFGSRKEIWADARTSRTAFLDFSLGDLTEAGSSGLLYLNVSSVARAGTISVHLVKGSWQEGSLTWDNAPPIAYVRVASAYVAAGATRLEIDVTAAVQKWADAPRRRYGLAVAGGTGRVSFASRETGQGSRLEIGAVAAGAQPETQDDALVVASGATLRGNVLDDNGNGPDQPGVAPTVALLRDSVDHGTLNWPRDGAFTYQSNAGFRGIDTFTYQLRDAEGTLSAQATATIEVSSRSATPNVLFFVADDLGWGDIGAYNSHAGVATPNLDRLAAAGMRFTDAHTSASKCAPTRYSLVTGNYQWRGQLDFGNWEYRTGSQILAGQRTLADVLGQAGYATAMVGKWHLGGNVYIKNRNTFATQSTAENLIDFERGFVSGARAHGFDYSYTLLRGMQGSPYAYFENDRIVGNPAQMKHLEAGRDGESIVQYAGIGMPDWNSAQVGPKLVRAATDFIVAHDAANRRAGTRTPFFLYYTSQSMHSPFTPPANLLGTPIRGTTGHGRAGDMLREVDVAFGKLIAVLEARGLADNTLIVFTSDNGGITNLARYGHDSMAGLRGYKGDSYEGGHRVPLIFKLGNGTMGGSLIEPGSSNGMLIAAHDAVATIAAAAGAAVPRDQFRDSFNFLPVLRGERAHPVRNELVMEGVTHDGQTVPQHFAIRSGPWKLIFDDRERPVELYDLDHDIGERRNLIRAPEHEGRVRSMTARLQELLTLGRTAP
jgi:arylsulfatase A-like enzyme